MLSAVAQEINVNVCAVADHKLFALKIALTQKFDLAPGAVVRVSKYDGSIHHKLARKANYRSVLEKHLDNPDGSGVEILFYVEGHPRWGPLTSENYPGVVVGHPVDIGRVERWLLKRSAFLNDEEKSQLIAAGRFGSNSGEEVWNAVVDRIKARVGGYPEDWPRLVFLGELFV